MSPRPLPAGARRTAYPPQSPSVQAMPAQPHAPRLTRIRERRDCAPTPPRGPRQPSPTCPALPAYARGWTACPAPPHPHTQGEGRRAQPSPPRHGRHLPSPTRPARIRERRDSAFTPPHGPCQPSPPAARVRKGRVGTSTPSAWAMPARRLHTPPHPRTPGDARGSVHPAQPPPRGACYPSPPGLHATPEKRCVQGGGLHARTRRGYAVRGTMQPEREPQAEELREGCAGGAEHILGGGAAHEQKGRHIGAQVRKGECDSEGVVNEVKRSRGEAVRANGRHPHQ
ncbi:hypothetical protein EDB83DRAFT_2522562 [Lactarius deliciosus]|nr:hypothetical protein EDB83DRAFT_2522562 [Lactarius deliciosus]